MSEPIADEQGVKVEVQHQLEEAKAFAKTLSLQEAEGGQWFLKLLAHVTRVYNRNARASYFQKKYPGLPADDIADILISLATRYAAITGGVTGAATTVGVVAAIPSGAATLALFVGSIGAEMLTLAGIQMRLVLDMATVYDLQLDTEDPEDVLMIFGYALGIAPTQAVSSGLSKAVPVATAHSVRKYVSKGTLDAVQKFGQRIGIRILQKTIIKYAIPVVSAGIGSTYNYVTTKSVGEIAKRHLKNRGKVTDELRALVSRRNAYDLVFPAAVMYMANADGCLGGKEKELYRAMLSRMSFEDHTPQEFDRLVRDKDCILDAIGQIEDPETLEALVEMLILMAIYDGAVVPEERDWLLCVADRARVPIDMVAVESRAKEYEVVVKETMVTKATELAGDAASLTKGKLKTLFVRVQARPERSPSTTDVD